MNKIDLKVDKLLTEQDIITELKTEINPEDIVKLNELTELGSYLLTKSTPKYGDIGVHPYTDKYNYETPYQTIVMTRFIVIHQNESGLKVHFHLWNVEISPLNRLSKVTTSKRGILTTKEILILGSINLAIFLIFYLLFYYFQ